MTTAPAIPAYRLFDTRVIRSRRLSPTFVRITLGAPSLRHFAPWGLDQRVKLILPHAGERAQTAPGPTGPHPWSGPFAGDVDGLSVDEWRAALARLPAHERHLARTYTTGSARPEECEVDIDFFIHHPAGPASRWAASAAPGDRILVSGPDVRADDRRRGIQWRPAELPTRVLLLGDETAIPALNGIVASLGAATRGTIVVEADDVHACPPIERVPSGVSVRLVARVHGLPGEALAQAVASWAASDARDARSAGVGFAAWIAAESSAVAGLCSAIIDAGVPRGRIHRQGYWRAEGRASSTSVNEVDRVAYP
ncbi:siderophore-interacting protein [Agreia sp. COWG]|uniref:siderophore-interacting protein n=1 Tax=Agreia sp. COWG TaxID=2773266 RepID=UPI0019267696|nr:siderophore-interacting protein [Agreia sp. COWG]CAD6011051.1 NADPH-dependent ferric siderophore reductase, contains FAD-binding and SIP domains [Agreia sp. COWG]